MAKIQSVVAWEILDSRGNPTVNARVALDDGRFADASCPSGASVGKYEALELRDHDEKRLKGMGVLKAVSNITNIIAPKLAGMDPIKQQDIDNTMISLDGTPNKSNLGANAILAVSMAVAKTAAISQNLELYQYLTAYTGQTPKVPIPIFNVINGGKHAGMNLDFQEFIVVPASSTSYPDALQMGATIYATLRETLQSQNYQILVGDEGGFGPNLPKNMQAFGLIKQAVDATLYKMGLNVFLGLDAAANSFYNDKTYRVRDRIDRLNSNDMINYYQELYNQYRVFYLEDPLFEDDWDGWKKLNSILSSGTLIVGDDLTVTNPYRLQTALQKKAITAIVIKPNQIGTVIEALGVAAIAKASGLKTVVSHRSGETNDTFAADFAVAVASDYAKFGATARGERVAKHNRLSEISKQLSLKK